MRHSPLRGGTGGQGAPACQPSLGQVLGQDNKAARPRAQGRTHWREVPIESAPSAKSASGKEDPMHQHPEACQPAASWEGREGRCPKSEPP